MSPQGPTAEELQQQIQHRLMEELRGRSEEFQTQLDLLENVAFRLDDQGFLRRLNPAWERLSGYSVAESLGRHLCEFMDDMAACEAMGVRMQSETAVSGEMTLRARDGSLRYVVLNARKRGDWYGSLNDLTETRKALGELEQSQALTRKLSLVASRTDNLVVITDAQGRIEWVNEGFERTSEYTLDEVIGRRPGELLQGPQTQPEAIDQMARGLARGHGFSVELINYTRSGRPYWVAIDCSPVHDAEGQVSNFVAIEREISNRKSAESALRASESRYRQILATVSEGIIRCDSALNIKFANPAWTRLSGVRVDDVHHPCLLEHIHPEDRPELLETRQEVIRDGKASKRDLRLRCAEGRWRRVELNMSATDFEGDPAHCDLTCAITDVEARWEAEQSSRRALQQAEELSRARTSFVANMSHEIRTPLNAIVGMVSVLERTTLSEEQSVCLQTIRNGSQALMALVGDILDLAKLDAGAVELDETEFSPLELFEGAVDMVASTLQDKGLSLTLDCAPGLPRLVRGDAARIRQIALNLLSNATKFTTHGRLHVRLRWTPPGVFQFSVADTGIGVPGDRLGALFDAFAQADASTTRRFGGTGLGLSICRQICELLGGRIRARSVQGRGSVFSVRIPLVAVQHVQPSGTKALRARNLDVSTLRSLRGLVDWAGVSLQVQNTMDPTPGLELLDKGRVTSALSGVSAEKLKTPLRLYHALEGAAPRAPSPRVEASVAAGLHILVAEDVIPNQIVIQAMLRQLGCEQIKIVDNGQAAVDWIADHRADFVFLDLHMPVMDGQTAAALIRERLGESTPPIWAISADVTTEARSGERAGVFDGWLTKPMTRDELTAVLRQARSGKEIIAA